MAANGDNKKEKSGISAGGCVWAMLNYFSTLCEIPIGKLLFTLMSAIAQFERDTIADRTREGLRAARARGRMGGRPQTNHEAVRKALKLYHTGQYSIREIEELTGIKKSTLYRNLKKNTNEGR